MGVKGILSMMVGGLRVEKLSDPETGPDDILAEYFGLKKSPLYCDGRSGTLEKTAG